MTQEAVFKVKVRSLTSDGGVVMDVTGLDFKPTTCVIYPGGTITYSTNLVDPEITNLDQAHSLLLKAKEK